MEQRVEHHRPTFIEVNRIAIEARVFRVVRVPAVNLECFGALCAIGGVRVLALLDFGILGECEFGHGFFSSFLRFSNRQGVFLFVFTCFFSVCFYLFIESDYQINQTFQTVNKIVVISGFGKGLSG